MKMSLIKASAFTVGITVLTLTPFAFAEAASGYGGGGGGGGGTGGCYGFITPPPGGFRIHFNNDVTDVTDPNVQLTVDGGDADRMAISNEPSFANAGSQPFTKKLGWKLPGGFGPKIVYIKLYDHCGTPRSIFSGSVNYKTGTITPIPGTGRVLGEKITAIDDLLAKVKYGMTSADVVALQDALKAAGFFPASVKSTGWYGPITQRAVNAYLAKQNAPVTADTSVPAADADLSTLVGSLKYNDRGESVKSLQTALRKLGFFPSWVRSTGWFGPITQSAVNKYKASK
jgi:hypothetical protein